MRVYGLFYDRKTPEGNKATQYNAKHLVFAEVNMSGGQGVLGIVRPSDMCREAALHEARKLNKEYGRPKLYIRRLDRMSDEQISDAQV